MTPEQAIEELKSLHGEGDWESAHGRADDILCELLKDLGHGDVAEAFDRVGKWYS